jgi:lysophospholipase L1-like esterase
MPKLKDTIIYCLVLLLTLEGLARVETFARSFKKEGTSLQDAQIRGPSGTKGKPHGVWGVVRLNRFGFHDEDDYEKKKAAGVVRVLCLGDSVTFGTHTPPDNWPQYLEESLRQKYPQVEVLNLSMPGNNYPQIVDQFETDWLDFEPDFVIMYKGFRHFLKGEGPEDAVDDPWWQRAALYSTFLNKLVRMEPKEAHERLLARRKTLGIKHLVTAVGAKNLETYRLQTERLVDLSQEHDFQLVLSSFPFLVDQGNRDEHMDLVNTALYFYPSISADAFISSIPQFDAVTRATAAGVDGVVFADIGQGLERSRRNFADCYHLTRLGARHVAARYEEVLEEFWEKRSPAVGSPPG